MKIKTDFVTNSSSSSFIIKRDAIDLDQLKNVVLKELYLKLKREYFTEEEYSDEELLEEYDPSTLEIEDAASFWLQETKDEQTGEDVYIIDNNCRIRFDWSVVEEVLEKHNLFYKLGYCD